jgi:hypothetical protein
MSSAAHTRVELAPPEISFVHAGGRSKPRRETCGRKLQGLYGCRSEDGTFFGRLVVLSCDCHDCPVDAPNWAEAQARRILDRAKGRLLHVQLTTERCGIRTEQDLETAFAEARALLHRAGAKRGWVWVHASGFQRIRGIDQIVDECPGEFHVHAVLVTDDPFGELGHKIDTERWGVRLTFARRRSGVVRNRAELQELLLRSSRAVTNNSAGSRRVVRSFGDSRGGRKPSTQVAKAEDSEGEPPDPLVNCPCCGKIHPKSRLGYWKLVDDGGRRADVPWDDNQVHALRDGESGLHLVRVLSKRALMFGEDT